MNPHLSIGNNAVASTFANIQRNRGNRFSMDLSDSSVIGVCQAYEAKQRKSKPNYSMASVIRILEAIEESERVAAETTILPRWLTCRMAWLIHAHRHLCRLLGGV